MGATRKIKKPAVNVGSSYGAFDCLDGDHPWMDSLPQGYVPYRVRELQTGQVAYFNFSLAKQMGLNPVDHPHQVTPLLEKKLIETFAIQIINEFDEQAGRQFSKARIKPKKYMASRYLQLQHVNKQGKTSGDGRGIWNGVVDHKGQTWDVSSRGTGVTCLSPGAVLAKKPLETGGGEFGYGCGKAEIDELYGAALMAEMMHLQGIATERVLCVIDLGKGYGIGVRAALNLLRPAHLFMYLKQNRQPELKAAVDYLIHRQVKNGRWKPKAKGNMIYEELAQEMGRTFAMFTATLDIDYVFAWLDWDGDNVLADAGIIDYGSVRQFGLRHDRYRYDDADRFSTNLNEQRLKARLMVQVFCQIADYLITGEKRPLKEFSNHPVTLRFNAQFSYYRAHRLLYRMGFNPKQREHILHEKNLFAEFDRAFSYFERAKVSGAVRKVPDGINHPPLFDMRTILRNMPRHLLANGRLEKMPDDEFFKVGLSKFAKMKDARKTPKNVRKSLDFQGLYMRLIQTATAQAPHKTLALEGICERAQKLNAENRITGNALIQIVEEILIQRRKGVSHQAIQTWIDQLVQVYVDLPEVNAGKWFVKAPRLIPHPDVFEKLLTLVQSYKHDI